MVPFLIWLGIGALVTWYHVKYQKFLLEKAAATKATSQTSTTVTAGKPHTDTHPPTSGTKSDPKPVEKTVDQEKPVVPDVKTEPEDVKPVEQSQKIIESVAVEAVATALEPKHTETITEPVVDTKPEEHIEEHVDTKPEEHVETKPGEHVEEHVESDVEHDSTDDTLPSNQLEEHDKPDEEPAHVEEHHEEHVEETREDKYSDGEVETQVEESLDHIEEHQDEKTDEHVAETTVEETHVTDEPHENGHVTEDGTRENKPEEVVVSEPEDDSYHDEETARHTAANEAGGNNLLVTELPRKAKLTKRKAVKFSETVVEFAENEDAVETHETHIKDEEESGGVLKVAETVFPHDVPDDDLDGEIDEDGEINEDEDKKEEPKAAVMPDTTNMTKREKLNARKAFLKSKKKLSKQEEDEVLLLEYEEEQLNEEEGITSEPEVRESPRKPTAVQEEKTHREVEQQQARQRRRSAFKYKAEVIYEYKSEDAQRLSIKPGDVIIVLEQGETGGWWLGELNGQEGYFPENYCKIIKPQRSISLKQDAAPAIKAIQAQLGFLNAAWYDERNKPTESKEI